MKKRKILLIGWDGADWKYLMPLIDKGLMPNLEKLINGGSMGRLATLDPPLSPTLWTSIATGKRPYQHGIHGFTEPDPSGEGIRPMYITNRKCKAIWNILTQHKMKNHVVGWWPSHPAEPINGTMVSNLYQRASGGLNDPWPMLKGTVHPAEKSELFAKLRVHPHELTGNHLQPFVEKMEQIDQTQDKRLMSIAKVLADCSTIHSAATYIMDNEEWDFMGVYYDAIDHFCHGFMKYHPPRRPHIPMRDYELYNDVVNAGCRYHDMMLGRMMEMVDDDTTIILVSDHGFHPDHNRPTAIPKEPAGPAIEHSPYGIIVMNGPGIKKDDTIFGASLLDITPTILALYGMPVAEDMDGKVLINAFENPPEIKTIKSWENIKGEDGSHAKDTVINEDDARAELQQLIELGYIADPGENGAAAVKGTVDENNYNLARSYIDGQKWEEGIAILEKLQTENPETLRFNVRLAHAYQSTGKLNDARRIVDHIRSIFNRESPQLDILEGTLLLGEERYKKALELFQKVEREAGEQPNLHLRIANAYLRLNRLDDAEKAVLKELKVNSEEVSAHYTLGQIYYQKMQYEDALNAFMDTVGLLYYYPAAHFYIGESLNAMGEYEKAIEAYDTCLKLVPGINTARQRIISIYETRLEQPGKARKYQTSFEETIKGTINIVSGLPRSGTSMMMQMLEAGGLEIFTDKKREADENNPKGYYEHEAVKSLQKNKAFLAEANGKTVKIIAQLLQTLPMNYRYRIVFMERNIYEVVASQQKMLERDGKRVKTDTLPLNLVQQYETTLKKVKEWAANQANVEIHYVNYSEVMQAPFLQAMLVNDFFDGSLEVEQMAGMVDAALYREKMTAV
ncbi:MAG: putative AlkP superfamily phosphohydrolase/phosphomutase/tetratricopeptide (TPR) repeat protein [Saprospiraceae bacterium]|jgi:predicted AlkP superfamily phosphohydrolase/phosphomutase/tetratricopeptide (TPR) repeat protein